MNARLDQILSLPASRSCADCGERRPRWASVNIGCFLCINCAAVHRGMGVHISVVKSVTLDKWKSEWVNVMTKVGNRVANDYYEHGLPRGITRPTAGASNEELRRWIRNKYVAKLYVPPGTPSPGDLVAGGRDPLGSEQEGASDKKNTSEPSDVAVASLAASNTSTTVHDLLDFASPASPTARSSSVSTSASLLDIQDDATPMRHKATLSTPRSVAFQQDVAPTTASDIAASVRSSSISTTASLLDVSDDVTQGRQNAAPSTPRTEVSPQEPFRLSEKVSNPQAALTLTDETLKSLYSQTPSSSEDGKKSLLRRVGALSKSQSLDPFAGLPISSHVDFAISREGNLYCPCCRTMLQQGTRREDVISDRFAALRFGTTSLHCPCCCEMVSRDICLDDPSGPRRARSAYDSIASPVARSGPAIGLSTDGCLKKSDAEKPVDKPSATDLALAQLEAEAFATLDREQMRHGR